MYVFGVIKVVRDFRRREEWSEKEKLEAMRIQGDAAFVRGGLPIPSRGRTRRRKI